MPATDMSGEKVSEMSYNNWSPGEPNSKTDDEACMHLWSRMHYQWNDRPCSFSQCSVCEIDLIQTSTHCNHVLAA